MYLINHIISFYFGENYHEEFRSIERPKIQTQRPVKSESNPTTNLLPSYDNSRTDQPFQDRMQQKLIIPKKVEESQTTNVLLLSSIRSGGAFLGQLLNNINPDTFYSIDPLPMAVLNQVRPRNLGNAIMYDKINFNGAFYFHVLLHIFKIFFFNFHSNHRMIFFLSVRAKLKKNILPSDTLYIHTMIAMKICRRT